jgi:methylase of polypeptide subunit release factors
LASAALFFFKRWEVSVTEWRFQTFGNIDVAYKDHLDGGGTTFGQDYITLFKRLAIQSQRRIFEWCAGPGFIGFSLLGHGFCESLCLADINPEAVLACQETVSRNVLCDRVSIYQSDNLDSIPPSERWDLVVGNPPHFSDMSRFDGPEGYELRVHDPFWRIHQRFYQKLGQFLTPDGVAIIQENNQGSIPSDFDGMIEDARLRRAFNIGGQDQLTDAASFYFLGVGRQNDCLPDWVLHSDLR